MDGCSEVMRRCLVFAGAVMAGFVTGLAAAGLGALPGLPPAVLIREVLVSLLTWPLGVAEISGAWLFVIVPEWAEGIESAKTFWGLPGFLVVVTGFIGILRRRGPEWRWRACIFVATGSHGLLYGAMHHHWGFHLLTWPAFGLVMIAALAMVVGIHRRHEARWREHLAGLEAVNAARRARQNRQPTETNGGADG